MSIVNILFIIVAAVLIADLINRKIEDVLPVTVFAMLLMLYGVAILGKAHHSYEGTLILLVLILIFYAVKKKRLFPTPGFLRDNVVSPGFIIYLIVIALVFLAYGNHMVVVWDDFHYNATFPKDMYYYGAMPTGGHSATFYRSYPPLMQLFFYWGFQGIRAFSEPLMFRYKMFLVYTCILPLFKGISYKDKPVKGAALTVMTVCLPYLFMYELIESLSMDTFMALLFGYALYHIVCINRKGLFDHVRIITSLACLTLVKQIAPIFTLIALGTWLVLEVGEWLYHKKKRPDKYSPDIFPWIIASAVSAGAYLSWKIFCNIKGNSVYLSGKLVGSVEGGRFILPEYAGDTIRDFVRSVFTYHLSFENNGLTLFATALLVFLLMVVMARSGRGRKRIYVGFILILLGLIGYLAVLLYTYLFVFEPWEAESLASLDRYFGTYALALAYVAIGGICFYDAWYGYDAGGKTMMGAGPEIIVLAVISLVCLPWMNMYYNLIPSEYAKSHEWARRDRIEVEEETSLAHPEKLPVKKVMVVTNEGNSVYSRATIYDLIPLVPAEYGVHDAVGDASVELRDKCRDEKAYYVYFSGRLVDDEVRSAMVSPAIENGEMPRRGVMYYYDEAENIIKEYRE